MAFVERIVIIFAVHLLYSSNSVSALSEEAILNGVPAPSNSFTYQASIVGLQRGVNVHYNLLGGGAIISDKHIISAANIFLLPSGELQPWIFAAVVGIHDAAIRSPPLLYIQQIFFTSYDKKFLYFNVAVAELKKGVGLGQNPHVSQVRLADPGSIFTAEATVSGFGLYLLYDNPNRNSSTSYDVTGALSPELRFRQVTLLLDNDCAKSYPSEVTVTNMCGLMYRYTSEQGPVGLCKSDDGNPLVVDNDLLIGIASKIPALCDNTQVPALYMKISAFKMNIENFMLGILGHDAFVLANNS